MRTAASVSSETVEAKRQWEDIFNMLKEKDFQPRILHEATFKIKSKLKYSQINKKLRKTVTSRAAQ